MNPTITRQLVTLSAVIYSLLGMAFLFLPMEVATALGLSSRAAITVSMWSAGLLGIASMNWASRASILGGIYGRAVVVGNQVHATIGALVLLRFIFEEGSETTWLLVVAFSVYAFGTVLYTYMMMTHPKSSDGSNTRNANKGI